MDGIDFLTYIFPLSKKFIISLMSPNFPIFTIDLITSSFISKEGLLSISNKGLRAERILILPNATTAVFLASIKLSVRASINIGLEASGALFAITLIIV